MTNTKTTETSRLADTLAWGGTLYPHERSMAADILFEWATAGGLNTSKFARESIESLDLDELRSGWGDEVADFVAEHLNTARPDALTLLDESDDLDKDNRALAQAIIDAADEGGTLQGADVLRVAPGADPRLHTTTNMRVLARALGCEAEMMAITGHED